MTISILAGGQSQRMGTDKAFLEYKGSSFIQIISNEMLKISNDVLVIIGTKDSSPFEKVLDPSVRIFNDEYRIGNPMGGMLSATKYAKNEYSAFLACDTPLVKNRLVKYLYDLSLGHSAAIPGTKRNDCEPLCAVYNIQAVKDAGLEALKRNKIGCKNLISFLSDVVYVNVEELRHFDPKLDSFLNINSQKDLDSLRLSK